MIKHSATPVLRWPRHQKYAPMAAETRSMARNTR